MHSLLPSAQYKKYKDITATFGAKRNKFFVLYKIFVSPVSIRQTDPLMLSGVLRFLVIKKALGYYLAAHRRVVNVLTSNGAFLIFAVLVV